MSYQAARGRIVSVDEIAVTVVYGVPFVIGMVERVGSLGKDLKRHPFRDRELAAH